MTIMYFHIMELSNFRLESMYTKKAMAHLCKWSTAENVLELPKMYSADRK